LAEATLAVSLSKRWACQAELARGELQVLHRWSVEVSQS